MCSEPSLTSDEALRLPLTREGWGKTQRTREPRPVISQILTRFAPVQSAFSTLKRGFSPLAPSSRRKKQVATPPAHLATKTKAWFKAVCEDYDLEDHHVRLLTLASEAWDRCEQARDGIQMHGLTYEDRFGAPHARPEIAIERDSRIAFARLIREMDLDVEGPAGAEPARLPPLRSNRRGT